jgi:hypothetical protein
MAQPQSHKAKIIDYILLIGGAIAWLVIVDGDRLLPYGSKRLKGEENPG